MRILLAALIAAAVAGCATCNGNAFVCDNPNRTPPWTQQQKVLWTVNLGCAAADVWTTAWGLQHDDRAYELNALMGPHPSTKKLVAIKAAGVLAETIVLDQYFEDGHRDTGLIILSAAQCGAAVWNWHETH